ncbi:MAG: peptidase domain-containing ABC transporter [Lysobacter sp.]
MNIAKRRGAAKTRFVSQTSAADCGHACISMLLSGLGLRMPMLALAARYPVSQRGMSAKEMLDVLRMCGVRPRALRASDGGVEALKHVALPVIVHLRREHFVVVSAIDEREVTVLDPAAGERRVPHAEFQTQWSGVFIGAERDPAMQARAPASPLGQLFKEFLSEHWPLWLFLLSVIALTVATTISFPWLLSRAVTFLAYGGKGSATGLGVGLLVLSLAFVIAHWMRARVSLMIQLRLDRSLITRFVDRLLHLPLRIFSLLPAGDLIARVNSVSGVRDFLSARITGLILDLGVLLATLAVLAFQSAPVALLFLALTSLSTVVLIACWKRLLRLTGGEVLAYSGYYSTLAETLTMAVDVKVNRKEDVFADRLMKRFGEHQHWLEARGKLNAVFEALYAYQDKVVPIAALLLLFVAFPSIDLSDQTAFYCYFLLGWTGPSVRAIQMFFMQLVVVRINADRIESIQGLMALDETTPAADAQAPVWDEPSLVTVRGLGFSYLGTGTPVLDNLSASFDDRGLNVIVGPSGCGKSTLLKLIGGLLLPDSGHVQVRIKGERAGAPGAAAVAYLNQHPALFAGSVAENIAMFDPKPELERIERCARAACIHEEIAGWPLAYQTQVVSVGQSLSAGQCQRIALARLLYSHAPIMLLDEFTSDIDTATEGAILRNLRQWPGMKIIVTHRTQWIAPVDRVHDLGRSEQGEQRYERPVYA